MNGTCCPAVYSAAQTLAITANLISWGALDALKRKRIFFSMDDDVV